MHTSTETKHEQTPPPGEEITITSLPFTPLLSKQLLISSGKISQIDIAVVTFCPAGKQSETDDVVADGRKI